MKRVLLAWTLGTALGLAAPVLGADGPGPVEILLGPLLPEGSPGDAPGTVELADVRTPLALDLQQPRPVRALLLQADGNDVYWVEGSLDARTWSTLWRVPAFGGLPGLRTRATVLGAPVSLRYVRVRATFGDGAFSVARLRLEAEVPPAWPPPLVQLEGRGEPPFPALKPSVVLALRHALGGLALLLAGWGYWRPEAPAREARLRRALLGLVAALSVAGWPNFGNFHYYAGRLHLHEAFHYFLGAKYLPEIGYTGLYASAALAEREDDPASDRAGRTVRNLTDNQPVPFERAADDGQAFRERFAPERWQAFRGDVRWFRERLPAQLWASTLNDHGFNAAPAWLLLARPLAEAGPLSIFHLEWLAALDLLLVVTLLLLIQRSFGFEAACLVAVYWGLNSFSRFTWTGGGILRLDWLWLSVAALCAQRRGRPLLAGLAVGYAGLIRLFPFFLAGGVALQGLVAVAEARSLRPLREQARFWAGLGLSLLLLVPLSGWRAGGLQAWTEFSVNSRRMVGTEASNILGLPVVLAWRPGLQRALNIDPLRENPLEAWEQTQAESVRATRPAVAVAALAFVALLALAVRRRPAWVAALLGLGLVPIVHRLANYYFCWPLVYALLLEVCPPAGLVLTFTAWASNLLADAFPDYDSGRALASSLLVCALVVGLTARLARLPAGPPDDASPR